MISTNNPHARRSARLRFVSASAFALLAPCLFSAASVGGPLATRGIPADTQGLVHIDCATAYKTQTGITLFDFFERQSALSVAAQSARANFRKQCGYNPATDLASITLGLYPAPNPGGAPTVVAILRGNFPIEKILALTRHYKIAITTDGTHSLLAASNLGLMLAPALGQTFCAKFQHNNVACLVDRNTILFAPDAAIARKLLAAVTGLAPSAGAPAQLLGLGAQTGTPLVLACANRTLTPEGKGIADLAVQAPKAENILFALGQSGAQQRTRFQSEYASAEAAQKMQSSTKTVLMLLPAIISSDGSYSASDAQKITNLLAGLRTSASGRFFAAALESAPEDVASVLPLFLQ